jgi:hypothetical protein
MYLSLLNCFQLSHGMKIGARHLAVKLTNDEKFVYRKKIE